MKTAYIEISNLKLDIEFYDSVTAHIVYDQLPLASNVQRWGDELYFDVPIIGVEIEEDAREVMHEGEIGFWVEGSAIAIFFGATPASHAGEPRALVPINAFAKIVGTSEILKDIQEGDFIFFAR
ncbi:MAG: cyclophilin-like fold protein [bacterium]|nr:cyclophilin-like fold protein [bacterium]